MAVSYERSTPVSQARFLQCVTPDLPSRDNTKVLFILHCVGVEEERVRLVEV